MKQILLLVSFIELFSETQFRLFNKVRDNSEVSNLTSLCKPQTKILNCDCINFTEILKHISVQNSSSRSDTNETYTFRYTSVTSLRNQIFLSSVNVHPSCDMLQDIKLTWQLTFWGTTGAMSPEDLIEWLAKNKFNDKKVVETIRDQSFVYVQRKSLKSAVYDVQLTTKAVFGNIPGILTDTAQCLLWVVENPPQFMVVGGFKRYVYYKDNIEFNILRQIFLDRYEMSEDRPTVYFWKCSPIGHNTTKEEERFCNETELIIFNQSFRLITGPFQPSRTYNFSIRVSESVKEMEMRSSTFYQTHQIITTTDIPEASIYIECLLNCGGTVLRSNPQDIIHLRASRTEGKSGRIYKYDWKYSITGTGEMKNVSEIRRPFTNEYDFIVEEDSLGEGQRYTFMVATRGLQKEQFAEFILETCHFSPNVSCQLTPESGFYGTTIFSINCTFVKPNPIRETIYFPPSSFEFFNRRETEIEGRRLGFSYNGCLEGIILTRERLFVRTVNMYGAYSDNLVNVQLRWPETIVMPHFTITDTFLYDFYYRIGQITAASDLSHKFSLNNMTDFLIQKLVTSISETRDDITSLMVENALYNVVCSPKINWTAGQINATSLLSLSKLWRKFTFILRNKVMDPTESSRYISTRGIREALEGDLNCSNVVFGSKDNFDLNDLDIRESLELSTLYTMDALDNLLSVLAFKSLPSKLKMIIPSDHAMAFLMSTAPDDLKVEDLNSFIQKRLSESLVRFLMKGTGYHIQTIIFKKNPFWWGGGEKINTIVIRMQLARHGRYLEQFESKESFDFDLNVSEFEPSVISGSVKQPDDRNSPDINDFIVAVYRISSETNSESFVRFIGMSEDQVLRVVILKNQRPDYDNMLAESQVVNSKTPKLKFTASVKDYNSFFYLGILPGTNTKIGDSVNYTFKMFSATCNVWRYQMWMTGRECEVGQNTNKRNLLCSCHTLTLTLGGYMYAPIYDFNPFSDIPLLIEITDYPFAIIFLISVVIIYLYFFFWTKMKDEKCKRKVYTTILEDNNPMDSFGYLVGVFTGARVTAGTSSNVGIRLLGAKRSSRAHILRSSKYRALQSNSDDWFILFTPRHLGTVQKVKLWTDYSGSNPNWYCSKVVVCDLQMYDMDVFFIESWFGINLQEVYLKHLTPRATYAEANRSRRVFWENVKDGFRENHLWISTLARHPRSLLKRYHWLMIEMCSFFCAMCFSNLMYTVQSFMHVDYDKYEMSSGFVVTGVLSGAVESLVSIIFCHLFRRSFSVLQSPPDFHEHIDLKDLHHITLSSSAYMMRPIVANVLKKTIKLIRPKLCLIMPVQSEEGSFVCVKIDKRKLCLAWFVSVIVVLLSSYITAHCSVFFGKYKMLTWLTSLLIAVVISRMIISPITIIITAYLLSLSKDRYWNLISHSIAMNKVVETMKMKDNEEYYEALVELRSSTIYRSVTHAEVRRLRSRHYMFVWISTSLYITSCLTIIVILFCLTSSFDLHLYYVKHSSLANDVKEFSKELSELSQHPTKNSIEILMDFIQRSIVGQMLFSTKWYNGQSMSLQREEFPALGWLRDGTSRMIGYARMRQIRVKYDQTLCEVPKVMYNFSYKCLLPLTSETEDREDYSTAWSKQGDWDDTGCFSQIRDNSPWVFQESDEGHGIEIQSRSGYQCHGGYIAYFERNRGDTNRILDNLVHSKWLGRRTRVVILEFTIYNVNYNMFTSVALTAEILPIGHFEKSLIFSSVVLKDLYLISLLFVVLFFLYFLQVLVFVNIKGTTVFVQNLWNIHDLAILVSFFAVVVYYLNARVRVSKYKETLRRVGKDQFHDIGAVRSVSIDGSNAGPAISVLFVLATFRLMRIIRFNTRVRGYIHDLCAVGHEICWTWLVFAAYMFVHCRFIMYLLVEPPVYRLADVFVFQSEFKKEIYEYNDITGKLLAYFFNLISKAGIFTYTCFLTHYYRRGLMAPQRPLEPVVTMRDRVPFSLLWKSRYD